jgi:glyoxylase-like metal-dependent hydrolase (beta-lactamase superfamily II)
MKKVLILLAFVGSFAHADYSCSVGPLTKAFQVPLAPGQPEVFLFNDADGVAYWLGLSGDAKPVYTIKTKVSGNDVLVIAGDAGDAFTLFNKAKGVQILCNKAN